MEPAKRKITDSIPLHGASDGPQHSPFSQDEPSLPKIPKGELFDCEDFRTRFDKGSLDEKYLQIRSLASLNTPLPLGKLQSIIRKYQDFNGLNLGAFLVDCKNNPTVACAKHFGRLAQLEQRQVVKDLKEKVNQAAGGVRFPFLSSANLLGDYFINGTIIEGVDVDSACALFVKTFAIAAKVYGFVHPEAERYLGELRDWSARLKEENAVFGEPCYKQESLQQLAQDMWNALNERGEVLLPGGYKTNDGGHALLYHIRLDEQGVIFDIYNSGAGIETYHLKSSGTKKKYLPFYRIETDEIKRLTPHFLAVLMGNLIDYIELGADRAAGDVYEFVKIGLNYTSAGALAEEAEAREFITPQRAGTCATRCILAFLHHTMTQTDYARFKHYAQEIHVCLMDKDHPETQSVFPHIAKNLYRNILKQFEAKLISFADFFRTYALLMETFTSPHSAFTVTLPASKKYDTAFPLEITEPLFKEQKSHSLIRLFNDPTPLTPTVSPIENERELLFKLPEWTKALEELLRLNKQEEAALFYHEIMAAMPSFTSQSIWPFSKPEVESISGCLKTLGTSLIGLKEGLKPDELIYRTYLFALHLCLCKSILKKEHPNEEAARLLEPYSLDLATDCHNIKEIVSPATEMKFSTVKNYFNFDSIAFADKQWFEISNGYEPIIPFGSKSTIVAFFNCYFRAVGKASIIPRPYNADWYANIFFKRQRLLPEFIYDLIDQYKTLFTNAYSGLAGYALEKRFHDHETQLIGQWTIGQSETVKEFRFPAGSIKANRSNIRIYALLLQMEKDPHLIREAFFQQKLLEAFFKTNPEKSLLRAELSTVEANRILNRLRQLLFRQINKAANEYDYKTFLFLCSLMRSIQSTLELPPPIYVVFKFDRIVTHELFEQMEPKVPLDFKAQFTLEWLRLHEATKRFDEKWLKKCLGFLAAGSKDKSKAYYEGCVLLRHRTSEIQRLFEDIQNKDELFKVLDIGPGNVQYRWPLIAYSGITFNLTNGERAAGDRLIVHYQAQKNDSKGVQTVFVKTEQLIESAQGELVGNGLLVNRHYPDNPVVRGNKLEELLQAKIDPKDRDKWFIYNSDLKSSTLKSIFRISRFSCWYSDKDRLQYIIDKERSRVVKGTIHGTTVMYQDLTNGMTLIKAAPDGLNALFSRLDRTDQYLVWQKQDSGDIFVEFPASRIEFNLSFKEQKIFCVNYPGFFVAQDQKTWPHSRHGLTLMNSEGKQLFLLTDRKFTTADQKSIPYSSEINAEECDDRVKVICVTILPPDKLGLKERYEGSNPDLLIFARFLASIGAFEEAVRIIKLIKTSLYDADVAAGLVSIVNESPFTFFIGHPDYHAFMLHVSDFLLTIRKVREVDKAVLSKIRSCFSSYRSNATNISYSCQLNEEQLALIAFAAEKKPAARVHESEKISRNEIFKSIKQSSRHIDKDVHIDPMDHLYYDPHPIRKLFLPLFSLIAKGIVEKNEQLLEEGLYPAIYHRERYRNYPNDFFALGLIILANDPEYQEILKKHLPRKLLASEDPNVWFGTLMAFLDEAAAMQMTPKMEQSQPPKVNENRQAGVVERPPITVKRKMPADSVSAKAFKSQENKVTPRDLLERYFEKEIYNYAPVNFAFETASRVARQIFQKVNEDIADNRSQKKYVLKDLAQLPALRKDIQALIAGYQAQAASAEALVKELSAYATTGSEEEFLFQLKDVSKQRGGKKTENTLKALLDRYLVSDTQPFPDLKLEQAVAAWIEALLQLNAATVALQEDDPHLLALRLKRGARGDTTIARASSFFEMVTGKLLRKRQWKIVQTAHMHEKQVYQLPSGEGKTSVITPDLILARLAMMKSVFNIVPRGNLETDYNNLRRFFAENTGYNVHLFNFDRSATQEEILLLLDIIDAAKIHPSVFVTDPSSIQAVFLKYCEALVASEAKQAGDLEKILSFLIEDCTAIMDEVHLVLSPLHYLNYASKEEKPLDQFHWTVANQLYRLMQQLNERMTDHFFPIGIFDKSPFAVEHYHRALKPLLINALVNHPRYQYNRAPFRNYLSAEAEKLTAEERQVLLKWLSSLPQEIQKEVQLLRAQLNIYLPHTLSLRCFVNYGPGEGVDCAIPYKGNLDPSYKSSFQNNDILLNLTIQLYLNRGLDQKQLIKLIEFWKIRQPMMGEKLNPPMNLFKIDMENESEMLRYTQCWGRDPTAIAHYLNYIVFPEIRVQTHRFASTAYDLSNLLFPRLTAFTATLLSTYTTLPQEVLVHFDGRVHAEMVDHLLNPNHTSLVVQDKLDFKLLMPIPHLCMVLDPHALLEGRSNESVAQELLAAGHEYFGRCAYYDNKSNFLTSVAGSSADPNKTVTYLDQIHTTGVDIVQPPNGAALLLLNTNLTFTELLQAAKRLRGYGQGQKIVLVAVQKLAESIMDTLKVPQLTLHAIVLWSLLNEASAAQKISQVSFDQQLISVYRKGLLSQLMQTKDPVKKDALVNEFNGLMREKVSTEEFMELASLEPPKSPLTKFLEKYEEYQRLYGALLDSKQNIELEALRHLAEVQLGDQEKETSEQLNLTAQKEQQIYKETEDEINTWKGNKTEQLWDVKEMLLSDTLLKDWSSERLKGYYTFNSPSGKAPLHMIPFSFMTGSIPVRSDLFVTGNFSRHLIKSPADHTYFENLIPKIEFILDIVGPDNTHKYLILSRGEADRVRDARLFNQRINPVRFHLFDAAGYRITGHMEGEPLMDKEILATAKFFNGETRLTQDERIVMKKWLSTGTALKIDHFVKSASYRKATYIRNLQGTVIQGLFNELMQK